jgi:hypothetical protein
LENSSKSIDTKGIEKVDNKEKGRRSTGKTREAARLRGEREHARERGRLCVNEL